MGWPSTCHTEEVILGVTLFLETDPLADMPDKRSPANDAALMELPDAVRAGALAPRRVLPESLVPALPFRPWRGADIVLPRSRTASGASLEAVRVGCENLVAAEALVQPRMGRKGGSRCKATIKGN